MQPLITLLPFIFAANISSIHAMKISCSNKKAFLDLALSPQHQAYNQAKKLHENHNTPETMELLEDALEKILEAKWSQFSYKTEQQEYCIQAKKVHEQYNAPKAMARL